MFNTTNVLFPLPEIGCCTTGDGANTTQDQTKHMLTLPTFRVCCFSSPTPTLQNTPYQQVAQKTDANQLCRTLLVSDKARVTVMPSMEIIANDVKCTHGATICDLEDEELFYLMSRGISKISVS